MAKYIPGTTIHYGRSRSVKRGTVYFDPEHDEPIAFSQEMSDAGYRPGAAHIRCTVGNFTGRQSVPCIAINVPIISRRPDDDSLDVYDIRSHCVRRYTCRAHLDRCESEILAGDRRDVNIAKLNRAGRKAWGRARTDAHNATLLEMWRSRHPETVAS